jgi:MFS family permease
VIVFGLLSFLETTAEPTEGLPAQPVRTLLLAWGSQAGQVATFWAVLGVPWISKPLFGVLIDVIPLGHSRRKLWLVSAGALAAAAFIGLTLDPFQTPAPRRLFVWLFIATLAMAMADVVTDALIVDWGHVQGRTGRYQAAQWLCVYASGLLTGTAGGYFSAHGRSGTAFFVSALASGATLLLSASSVREPPRRALEATSLADPPGRRSFGELLQALRGRAVLGVAAFMFLWSFNPFAFTVLHLHIRDALGLGEQFFGDSLSLFALSSIVAAALYGVYSRRVSMRVLIHVAVVLGIFGALVYAAMTDWTSAVIVTLAVGFTSMTANLIQFELAARACPPQAVGTVFASFMAVSNLSATLSSWLGGIGYERMSPAWGPTTAFRVLVVIGAATTTGCWLVVTLLPPDVLATRDQRGGSEFGTQ